MNGSVYIINFWYGAAYGGPLTAYALQEIVQLHSYNTFLIDNKTFTDNLINSKFVFTNNFWDKYFKKTANISHYNDFLKFNDDGEIFITGSDQVFRPKYIKNKEYQYFLDYVNKDKKKIAFSASFGVDKEQFLKENSNDIIEHMKNALKSFDFVSVREKSGVEICKDVFGIDAKWIIDPVFILDSEKFNEIANNATKDYSNKIVSYVLDNTKEYNKIYQHLAKHYNSEVVKLADSDESIENWLSAIKNCKFLITDSFHGMCFAIIFNKPFICISNKARGASRFESVLELLEIENQCIDSIDEIFHKDCIFNVNWTKVNENIEKQRKIGLEFLKEALEAETIHSEEKIKAKAKFLESEICELEQQANLKYQIKKELWNLWLIIWHKFLPNKIKFIFNIFRRKNAR